VNIRSLLALFLSMGVLFTGLLLSTDDVTIFWDAVSLFIVFGGTIAATSISFRITKIMKLVKVFFQRILKDKGLAEYHEIIIELMKLGEAYRTNSRKFKPMIDNLEDPFLKDSMITFTDGVLEKEEFFNVLQNRAENSYQHHIQDANKFKIVSKFPPAFGMMGTTIGMIVLLSNLAGADAAKTIGPAMSICLITTLYGVALANLLVIPIAENLTTGAKEIYFKNTIIIEGVKLIHQKQNPVIIAEVLNSFLKPSDRVDWKKAIK